MSDDYVLAILSPDGKWRVTYITTDSHPLVAQTPGIVDRGIVRWDFAYQVFNVRVSPRQIHRVHVLIVGKDDYPEIEDDELEAMKSAVFSLISRSEQSSITLVED